jgi:hypothetical protein
MKPAAANCYSASCPKPGSHPTPQAGRLQAGKWKLPLELYRSTRDDPRELQSKISHGRRNDTRVDPSADLDPSNDPCRKAHDSNHNGDNTGD